MPLVIRSATADPAWIQRQPWLGPLQRLNLSFLIDTEHHGVFRRIHIQTNKINHLVGERGITAVLEGFQSIMRRQQLLQHTGLAFGRVTGHFSNPTAPCSFELQNQLRRQLSCILTQWAIEALKDLKIREY